MTEHDIVFCSETWQKSDSKFSIDGYKCITVPRPESMLIRGRGKRGHGGICLFVRHTLCAGVEIIERHTSGFLWVKLCKTFFGFQDDIFVCFCYIPPKNSVYYQNVDVNLFDVLERNIRHYSDYGKIMVIGDLNARTGLSSDHSESCDNIEKYIHCLEGAELNLDADVSVGRRFSLDTKIESSGVKLLQICKDAGLRILNGRLGEDAGIGNFTFQSSRGKSVIDYVICSPSLFKIVHSFCVHDISVFSDHAPLQLIIRSNVNTVISQGSEVVKKLSWDTDKVADFKNVLGNNLHILETCINDIVSQNSNIDDGVNNFAQTLYNSAFDVFGKVKRLGINGNTQRLYSSPWFNQECETARAELKRANKQFRKYRTHELHSVVINKRKYYSKVKRHARFKYNQAKKKRLHNLASSNPKAFWQEIRKMKTSGNSNQCSLSIEDFAEHFKEVYSESSNFSIENVEQFVNEALLNDNDSEVNNQVHYDTSQLDGIITCAEVKKAVFKLKRNKSPGYDLLPPELFLDSFDLIGDMLCKLFNFIFSNNLYPDSWTKGLIVPVPKKGDLTNVSNYRGITLTSIFSKIY